MSKIIGVLVGLSFPLVLIGSRPPDPAVGRSYKVPYRLTETNHWLVRARINGKGPFNFLVDTGAPAIYVGTEAARKARLVPADDDYWTPIDRIEIEGGALLEKIKVRIEDPFQLVGMNALGLPGASIDGILGFTALARFKLEFDPTRDRMTWTRLDFEPREPFLPKSARTKNGPETPPELQMMQSMGPLMKLMAVFVGKQPEEKLEPRGFLGLELQGGGEGHGVRVVRTLAGSPAASSHFQSGDVLVAIDDRPVNDLASVHAAVGSLRPGAALEVKVRRGDKEEVLELTAGKGF